MPTHKAVAEKVRILVIVGARACGASTLNNLLAKILGPSFLPLDCSGVCDDHISRRTKIGQQLEHHKGDRISGGLYPDELVVAANVHRITEEVADKPHLLDIGIAGGIRKPEQYGYWREMGFDVQAAHIVSPGIRYVFEGAWRRKLQGIERADCNPDSLIKSWKMYQDHILPAMEMFDVNKRVRINQELSPVSRVETLLSDAKIPGWSDAYRVFKNPGNEARLKAEKLHAEISNLPVVLPDDWEAALQKYLTECAIKTTSTFRADRKSLPQQPWVPGSGFRLIDLSKPLPSHVRVACS